jgi:hypothetical protein
LIEMPGEASERAHCAACLERAGLRRAPGEPAGVSHNEIWRRAAQ